MKDYIWLYALVLVAVMMVAFVRGYFGGGRARRGDHARDTSRAWASPQDVKDLWAHEHDLSRRVSLGSLGGNLIAAPRGASVLVTAPTRSMKTASVVIPTVLDWGAAPAVVASSKTDVLAITESERRARGPVWIFDPTDVLDRRDDVCRWSPLLGVVTFADAMRQAKWMIESSGDAAGGVEDADFWDRVAASCLASALFAAATSGSEIEDVTNWILDSAENVIDDRLRRAGDSDAIAKWQSFTGLHERTKTPGYQCVAGVLETFGHPLIRRSLTVGNPADHRVFTPARLLDSGGTLYLVAPQADQRLFRPVFDAMVASVQREVELRSSRLGGLRIDPPLLLMLDECANVAPPKDLDKIASAGSGQGIVLVSVWQSDAQIVDIYGPDRARTIRTNHLVQIMLPGVTDETTLRAVSEIIGDHQVRRVSSSRDGRTGVVSTSTTVEREPLAPPEYLRQLPAGSALVIIGRRKPMRTRVSGWYESPRLRSRIPGPVAAAFDAQYAGGNV